MPHIVLFSLAWCQDILGNHTIPVLVKVSYGGWHERSNLSKSDNDIIDVDISATGSYFNFTPDSASLPSSVFVLRRSVADAEANTEVEEPRAPAVVEKKGKARDKELVGSIPKVKRLTVKTVVDPKSLMHHHFPVLAGR